jgi:hypothetical protein
MAPRLQHFTNFHNTIDVEHMSKVCTICGFLFPILQSKRFNFVITIEFFINSIQINQKLIYLALDVGSLPHPPPLSLSHEVFWYIFSNLIIKNRTNVHDNHPNMMLKNCFQSITSLPRLLIFIMILQKEMLSSNTTWSNFVDDAILQ